MEAPRSQKWHSIFEIIEEPRTTDLQRSPAYQEALRAKISQMLLAYMTTVSGYSTEHEEWQDEAECKGKTDLFFAPLDDDFIQTEVTRTNRSNESRRNLRIKKAKDVCAFCPVELECLGWAMRMGSHYDEGAICGGTTWFERKGLMRKIRDATRSFFAEYSSGGYSWQDEGPDMVRMVQLVSEEGSDVRGSQFSMVS